MKAVLGIIALCSLLLTVSSIEHEAFADSYTLKPASGSGAPGCESTGNGCYFPNPLIISVGDSVKFINTDSAAHTITSGTGEDGPSGEFDSGLLMAMNDFSVKLTTIGEIPYFCMVHPWMQGLIIVKESSSSSGYTPPKPSYTPPSSSGVDWQSKYLTVLSDFNEVSSKVGELQRENSDLRSQIADLEKTVNNLNAVIMEQVKVIYDWVLGK